MSFGILCVYSVAVKPSVEFCNWAGGRITTAVVRRPKSV